MAGHRWGRLCIMLALLGACGRAAGDEAAFETRAAFPGTSTTVAPPTTAPTTAPPTLPPTTRASTTTRPTVPPRPRIVHEQAWTPFAAVGGVTLRHPSSRVERDAFHESNHDGARMLELRPGVIDPIDLETRDRGTGARTAADVVVDPAVEIRAPVTGRVLRSGTYVLYCDYRDDFAVIEPDDHPGWEVKVLHIDGVMVRKGDRVQAAETVLAPRPTRLPFASQVDETTAPPPWPHVHLEVVDPSIPDRPGPGC